jgi:hypothetical protein
MRERNLHRGIMEVEVEVEVKEKLVLSSMTTHKTGAPGEMLGVAAAVRLSERA